MDYTAARGEFEKNCLDRTFADLPIGTGSEEDPTDPNNILVAVWESQDVLGAILGPLLRHPWAVVRCAAARYLARRGSTEALLVLRMFVDKQGPQRDRRVVAAAMAELAEIRKNDRPSLEAGLEPQAQAG